MQGDETRDEDAKRTAGNAAAAAQRAEHDAATARKRAEGDAAAAAARAAYEKESPTPSKESRPPQPRPIGQAP
jgi:hypothetical protein